MQKKQKTNVKKRTENKTAIEAKESVQKINILSAMFFKIIAHIDVIEKYTNTLKEKTAEVMDVATTATLDTIPIHVKSMDFIINDIIVQIQAINDEFELSQKIAN